MTERIVVRIEVDGVELSPIEMGEGKQDHFYADDISFFRMGALSNKENTMAPYNYVLRLTRHKTREEKLK